MLYRLKTALRVLLRKSQAEHELDEELRDHIERQTEQNIRLGMNPEEARCAARKAFGGVEQAKERSRDARGVRWIEDLWQDLRYGARMLRSQIGFTLIATLTLALGIGANTAIFSVVNAVLLRPLPFTDASRLLIVQEGGGGISYPNFLDLRAQASDFEGIAIFKATYCALTGEGLDAKRLPAAVVASNLFSVLGVSPALGRTFHPDEERYGGVSAGRPVILSHDLWQHRFKGDPRVVGRTLIIDGLPFTVIGVMPDGFQFPVLNDPVELWMTVAVHAEPTFHGGEYPRSRTSAYYSGALARLKPGVTPQQAQAELDRLAAELRSQYRVLNDQWRFRQMPVLEWLVGGSRLQLLLLLGAVTFVSLIACANVANLLLARAVLRRKEMAVRATLGAGRWRVLRQLLTESLLLAMLGGAAGLLAARWGLELLVAQIPRDIPRIVDIGLDWRVAGFSLAATLLTGLACGLAPALSAWRLDLTEALNEHGRGGGDGIRGRSIRGAIVILQVALTFVLLCGAGLLVQSFVRLRHIQPGFAPRHLLTFKLHLPESVYPQLSPPVTDFYRKLQERLRALPGVQEVSVAHMLPLSGSDIGTYVEIENRPLPPGQGLLTGMRIIDRNYFRTLSIPLLSGRDFNYSDGPQTSNKIIVNEAFVRRFLNGANPLGQRVKTLFGSGMLREIIGVACDVRHRSLRDEPRPEIYLPLAQFTFNEMSVIIRTATEPFSLTDQVRQIVRDLDQSLPVYDLKTMEQYLEGTLARQRFNTLLISLFAVLALLLAAVGLYGVLAHAVTQRTHEIGIRLALGAQRCDVLRLILWQGGTLALTGILIGLFGAIALTRWLKTMLFGVSATDPLTLASIAVLQVVVVLLACVVPARRATMVDPLVALRNE
jgi:putative ABC transport system permease protein